MKIFMVTWMSIMKIFIFLTFTFRILQKTTEKLALIVAGRESGANFVASVKTENYTREINGKV